MTAISAELIFTSRLALLPTRPEHADEMAEVLADPGLYTFIGGGPPDADTLYRRYEQIAAGSADPAVSWCNWVIMLRDPGCLAGTIEATITAGRLTVAEIAWIVGAPWQGQGIATEAARALIGWLSEQQVHTVSAYIHPDHQTSAAVAAAAGLTSTGQWADGEVRWLLVLPP
jgi:RimJ/RimL family protein N-acetyltransferase